MCCASLSTHTSAVYEANLRIFRLGEKQQQHDSDSASSQTEENHLTFFLRLQFVCNTRLICFYLSNRESVGFRLM